MIKTCRDIFRSLHEGRWLSITYKNKEGGITSYWIAVKDILVSKRMLVAEGFHLVRHTLQELSVYIDSIQASAVIEGSYYQPSQRLLADIQTNPSKYQSIFTHVSNLRVLNYFIDCSRLDTTPYKKDYRLIERLDMDSFHQGSCPLSDEQFNAIVRDFQQKAEREEHGKNNEVKIRQIAMNELSFHTKRGLYVLAYRKLYLNVRTRSLVPAREVTICREFTIEGERQSIRRFLEAEDYELLEHFEENQERIKDRLTAEKRQLQNVDDMPYVIAIEGRAAVDLNREYKGILDMYGSGKVEYPLRAFFGELVNRPDRRKEYPMALLNRKLNLDQLLAVHNGMKYPVTYVQGPPGTGKTNTIVNTIAAAFFNEKTVLFTSYNNHPIDSVFESLTRIRYGEELVPFPILRLGNLEKDAQALIYMRSLYERAKEIRIFSDALMKNREDRIRRTRQLTELLKRHEKFLDLKEREETLEKLIDSNRQMTFTTELQGHQLAQVRESLKRIGRVTDAEALALLCEEPGEFEKYLYYASAICLKRLEESRNEDLLKILYIEDKELRLKEFEGYLKNEANVKKLQRIFPVIATTCISAHKLGEPKPVFDMVIMDEASQCNIAIGLIPVIRGRNLMLVGDPQQLNPVILLDPKDNQILRRNYSVAKEYDYLENSIYKAFLASDSVSDEILLRCHYRCDRRIIDFNNRKYYNNRLNIMTQEEAKDPLVFIEMEEGRGAGRNTAPAEAEAVLRFVQEHREKSIGIITPFVNQKEYIERLMRDNGVVGVTCGTVHAFQGDEKEIILFSTALTDQTYKGTYEWLKNNKELINVATSRAKEQLVVLSSMKNLSRLRTQEEPDDLSELVDYVRTKGVSKITPRTAASRALGVKPYSSETEAAFLENLNHALDNILYGGRRCVIHKEVGISHVFLDNEVKEDLFYSGRFDFVVYEQTRDKQEIPILAMELDGKEHVEDALVKARDRKKEEICRRHGFELIRIDNSYARRYHHVKDILIQYFEKLYKI